MIRHGLQKHWYDSDPSTALKPLGYLYSGVMALRNRAYDNGWLTSYGVGTPVVVVGNIDIGGNGKTPMVMKLSRLLTARGWRVGIVARGYGAAKARRTLFPMRVMPDTDAALAGDEPVMIACRTGLPVVVDPDRVRGARYLINVNNVDVILADDGLQHRRLARRFEIALVDAERGFGNGWCLPAGPLREPVARLTSVNRVLSQGPDRDFILVPEMPRNLATGERRPLAAFSGSPVAALAGIAHPERFFSRLDHANIVYKAYRPGDHSQPPSKLLASELPVLMTDKDAVKWPSSQAERAWSIVVSIQFADEVQDDLMNAIETEIHTIRN